MRSARLLPLAALLAAAPASAAAPHPEHPRPDFRREPWANLNGEWSFEFDPRDEGEAQRWFEPGRHAFARRIIVPFPWESRLSGIGDTRYQGVAWYAREITIPSGGGWNGTDAWLVVGACDFEAKVWVNGKPAGRHIGGYMPFDINLAPFAGPGEKAFVVIRAKDTTHPDQPSGKQTGWYTRTSGIWQTVYVEPRTTIHMTTIRATPDIGAGTVRFDVSVSSPPPTFRPAQLRLTVRSPDGAFNPASAVSSESGLSATITIKEPKLWSPESPTLYDAVFELDGAGHLDRVHGYFGLREVSIGKAPGREYNYIRLNGKPIYLVGALHQSFHPDGIYQYPDDAAVRGDYEYCKKIGLNFLRIHIKNAIPRELYWADKLGVLIMQDMPNFTHYNERSRRWWEENLRAAVARDFNHPAIFAWCDFNETWGIGHGGYGPDHQRWVAEMYRLTKRLDPTRLVEDNSPCLYDHVVTDINSWHFYINDYEQAKRHIQEVVDKTFPGSAFNYAAGHKQGDAPLINSEYGGISAGLGDQDISWCFKYLTNELRKHDKICGYAYTELSDIEWEHNGFLNYDRSEKEFGYDYWHPGFTLKDLNNPDFIVLDAEPCIVLKPGEKRSVPVLISHWSQRPGEKLELRWFLRWQSVGERPTWSTRAVTWQPYAVTPQEPIEIGPAPDRPGAEGLGALLVELCDAGQVVARNYLNVYRPPPPRPRMEAIGAETLVLRCDPSDFSAWQWADQPIPHATGIAAEKVAAVGAGFVEYQFRIPAEAAVSDLSMIVFDAEMSAKAAGEKLDWPARKTPHDYPQTDRTKWPTDVRVRFNGVEVHRQTLPDDPADARGVLTHLHKHHPGSYGWAVRAKTTPATLREILPGLARDRTLAIRIEVPADAEHRGGLAVFGDRLGRVGLDPQCVLQFNGRHGLPTGSRSDEPVAVNRLAALQEIAIPTAEQGGQEWRYTVDLPAEDWAAPAFDDAKWRTSKGGFGTRETPNAIIGRKWTTPDIWLRTAINIADVATIVGGRWRIYHDEDAEVYLNGTKVLERAGFVTGYVDVPLDDAARGLLREGRNVVAVHCRQTAGGQNIDVGLVVFRRPKGAR